MRIAALLVVLAACRDHAAPAPPPPRPHVVSADARPTPPPPPLPPRGEHEVDELGYGSLAIGAHTKSVADLSEAPRDGLSIIRSGVVKRGATVEIDVHAEAVTELAITDPLATTRDGIRIGTPLAELAKRYGPPLDPRDRCRQYAKAPGIAFCGEAAVEHFQVPAHRAPPLPLGEDLVAIAARLDDHLISGRPLHAGHLGSDTASVVAPCLVFSDNGNWYDRQTFAVIAGNAVYDTAGGWRRPDGSMVICTASTPVATASVFELDATGHGSRWLFMDGAYFRREPAECTIKPPAITCSSSTELARTFEGEMVDTFILPKGSIHTTGKETLGEMRALRIDGAPIDACDRKLAQAWTRSVPARQALGLPTGDAARMEYLEHNHPFIGSCLAGTSEQPTRIYYTIDRTRQPYTALERAARRKELVGNWRQDDHYHRIYNWTFTPTEHIAGTDRNRYSLSPGALMIGERKYLFARIDADHFYIADPMFIDPIQCRADPTHAELDTGDGLLLIRGTTCSMILRDDDRLVPATCTETPSHTLDIRYTDKRLTLREVDGCLVEDWLKPFVRQ